MEEVADLQGAEAGVHRCRPTAKHGERAVDRRAVAHHCEAEGGDVQLPGRETKTLKESYAEAEDRAQIKAINRVAGRT